METDDVNTPAPLFSDPVHHAPTDPTLIQAPDGRWLMYYTQRRAADDGPAHTWVHGTDIAVASSRDGGTTWTYEGPVAGLDHLPGRNTLWAPEVIKVGDEFHMFLTHVPGVPSTWEGPRSITHLVSADLENWAFRSELALSSSRVIDACVYPLPDGGYRLWYKDEGHASQPWAVDSPDLFTWGEPFMVIQAPDGEGPNVFRLGGRYWLIIDEWRGQGVYSSDNLTTWTRDGVILEQPGTRPLDADIGRHADVVVGTDADGEEIAWIIYFTHRVVPGSVPEDELDADGIPLSHRTDVQVAAARVIDGHLVCDRDADPAFDLTRVRD